MFRLTVPTRIGLWASLQQLIAWNTSNAVAAAAAATETATTKQRSTTTTIKNISALKGTNGCVQPTHRPAQPLPFDSHKLDAVESVVRQRWSCKEYDPTRPVDKQLLERILAATTRSPTGFNLQGWYAIVVESASQKEALSRAALDQRQILSAPYTVVFVGDTECERYAPQALEMGLDSGYYSPTYGPTYLRNIFYYLHGGPLQSMAFTKATLSALYSKQTGKPLLSVPVSSWGYAWKQTMIPATTFMHLCTAAGLDTCMMEGLDEDAVKRILGLPSRLTVPIIISVGYAAPIVATGDPNDAKNKTVMSSRFAVGHTIRWDKF